MTIRKRSDQQPEPTLDLSAEAAEMRRTGDWSGARAEHLVETFAWLHEDIYKVQLAWPKRERTLAVARAREMLSDSFEGDAGDMAVMLHWLVQRERARSVRGGEVRSIGWRAAFSPSTLTDWRLSRRRKGLEDLVTDKIEAAEADEWRAQLKMTDSGVLRRCAANVVTILGRDPRWAGVLAFDEFAGALVTTSAPPWHPDDAPAEVACGEWSESDVTRACAWLSREHDVDVGSSTMIEAVAVVAHRRRIHPVRDYLRAQTWDRKPRADTWLVDFCGAQDTPYVRAVGAKFLVGAVARIMQPGCKVDHVPIIEGKQGIGKSTGIRMLASDAWHLETLDAIGTKDAQQQLRRKWIVELSELDSLSRAEVSRIKMFLSATTDNYRPSYGRAARDFPRQCVFVGTTNSSEYLKDETGGRRFWPVQVRNVNTERLKADRDQLWAEAFARYAAGEAWHLTDPSLVAEARAEAEERYVRDPWEGQIGRWLDDPCEPQRRTQGVTTGHILGDALDVPAGRWTRADEMRVASCLRRLGWTPTQRRCAGVRVRLYVPGLVSHNLGGLGGRDNDQVVTEVGTPPNAGNSRSDPPLSQPSQPKDRTHTRGTLDQGGTESAGGLSGTGWDVGTVVTTHPSPPHSTSLPTLAVTAEHLGAAAPGNGVGLPRSSR